MRRASRLVALVLRALGTLRQQPNDGPTSPGEYDARKADVLGRM